MTEETISIDYPESLAFSLKMGNTEFQQEVKTLSLVKLYELGKISSTRASEMLGISRIDFLELLGKYQVSYFARDLESDLTSDFDNA